MALAGHGVTVVVLEAEERLAAHQSGHNSGVIHSGLYYKPGSLKARSASRERATLYRFCAEEGIAHERCGKLVVATRDRTSCRGLDELERRGAANGLAGVRRLGAEEIREIEPHAAGIAGPPRAADRHRRLRRRWRAPTPGGSRRAGGGC